MRQASILIVEDDPEMRNIYRYSLEKEGFTLTEAANGAQALTLLESQTYDLLILDMLLPNMGGDTVLKRIKPMPEHAAMKIIILSAYPGFKEVATTYGVDDYLVKPITPNAIVATVRAVLEKN